MGGPEWGEKDHLLTLAYTVYLDGLNEMGFPLSQTRHFDNDGYYEAETIQDHSLAAVDQFRKDNKESAPGERVVVRYTRPEGKPLPALDVGKNALRKANTRKNKPHKNDPPSAGVSPA
ncbi:MULTISPECIES: hypothetical protein [unclassified Arthrobacter]|uniref:hypothetical protein n=1 Tax=unclassified Arthrobacter TaxID=235627 RepID=UPI001493154C|nr:MULTISPECIES: hypothetical protein [unclassified Arthrobacter]MBE0009602.1 hypothetical protein [Arthrobacter sp. AET 35A]NOJ63353.1 hypothetical protein [Arthrobacter sp. 147(2020)]